MSSRFLFPIVASVVLLAGSPLFAQLDPEPKTPYLWRIVLKVQPHPLLSPTFREQLKRDLEASLQPALGSLGTVDVIDLTDTPRDHWDSLWEQFDAKGFAALEAPRDLTGAKTHFLKLEYKDGLYLLEARQHDGFAGLSSGYAGFGTPVIRKQSVRAPEMVGRTAGLMLDRDFGLVGTVEPILGNTKEVKVIVRGGQLGRVDRFVKAGDVFAVSEVVKTNRAAPPPVRTATGKIIAQPQGSAPPPGLSAKLRLASLLKVIEVGADGILRCEALNREFTAGQGGAAAFRCMKLGTIDSPLTVRLVSRDGKSGKTANGFVSVRATEKGFDAPNDARDTLDFRDGLYRSARSLSNVACITVSLGPTQKRRFPVPILSSDPVNLPVEIDPKAEEQAAFERSAKTLIDRVSDARNAQTICFETTGELLKKETKNTEARDRAKSGLLAADTADKSISDELEHLRGSVDKSPTIGPRMLKAVEQHLTSLRQYNKQLEALIKKLDTVVAQENDPTFAAREVLADKLSVRINILLSSGDVDEAISAYDQLATLLPDDATVKAKQAKLKAEWAPKNDAHAKARTYLLKTWPTVATIPDFKESLPELAKNIDECKKHGDQYTLRKLLFIFSKAVAKLNDLIVPLDSNSDADRKLAVGANETLEVLRNKENEIQEFVKK